MEIRTFTVAGWDLQWQQGMKEMASEHRATYDHYFPLLSDHSHFCLF